MFRKMWGTHIFKSLNVLELVHGWRYNVSASLALHQLRFATKPYDFMLHILRTSNLAVLRILSCSFQFWNSQSLQASPYRILARSCQDPGKSLRILAGS